jgi:hypothetical protein
MFHGAETEPPVPSPDCRHKYLLPTEHRAPVPHIEAKVLAPSTDGSDTQSHLQRIKQRPVSALLDPRPSPPVGSSCAGGGMMSGVRFASPTTLASGPAPDWRSRRRRHLPAKTPRDGSLNLLFSFDTPQADAKDSIRWVLGRCPKLRSRAGLADARSRHLVCQHRWAGRRHR